MNAADARSEVTRLGITDLVAQVADGAPSLPPAARSGLAAILAAAPTVGEVRSRGKAA